MKPWSPATILPAALTLLAAALLVLWRSTGPVEGLVLRVPGLDRTDLPAREEIPAPPEVGGPMVSDGKPSQVSGAWPCFRGPNRDGIGDGGVPLARAWPAEGPEVLWMIDLLGPGHAGAAVSGGCVYVLDYDPEAQADTMRCLSLDDGREIWRNGYSVIVPENHGMSRTVPAVIGDYVVSFGPKCHVACWDAASGRCRWLLDLTAQYGAKFPEWYAAQCPLIDNGRVILAPAGKHVLMMAVDYNSGTILWRTEKPPELSSWEMTHVSIAPVEFQGRRMYVYCGTGGVAGVSADDGSLLWHSADWVGTMATCPTPVPVGDGRIFFTSGYHKPDQDGSLMLQLKQQDGRFVPEILFRLKPRQFESEHHTPIFFEGCLYGVRTKPGGEQLTCFDPKGNELWNSGRDKFGRGPYLIAGGLVYVMDDDGLLTMAEATSQGYKRLGRFQVFEDGRDAWGPMALAGGRLILRDLTRMACLNVAAK